MTLSSGRYFHCSAMLKLLKAGSLIVLLLFFYSCSNSAETLHLLSDRSELAIALEIYQQSHPNLHVIFKHVEKIDTRTVEQINPDLLIATDIHSAPMVNLLSPLEGRHSDYPAIVGPQNSKGRTVLIPLAFKLPLIMARRDTLESHSDGVIIRMQDINVNAEDFVQRNDNGRLTRLNFSPVWNPETYIDLLTLLTTQSNENLADGITNPDNNRFDQIADAEQNRIIETSGGIEADRMFNSRYHYIPDHQLITENYIRFIRTDFQAWSRIPAESLKQLDFRYFSGERKIPVYAVIWAGIPHKSSSSKEAEAFLDWLMRPQTQKELVERWEYEGLNIFGFLGGLSTLSEVNEKVLIATNSSLNGRIPENDFLVINPILPDRWIRIRNEVIFPWFTRTIHEPVYTEHIQEAYKRWDLSSLDEFN